MENRIFMQRFYFINDFNKDTIINTRTTIQTNLLESLGNLNQIKIVELIEIEKIKRKLHNIQTFYFLTFDSSTKFIIKINGIYLNLHLVSIYIQNFIQNSINPSNNKK